MAHPLAVKRQLVIWVLLAVLFVAAAAGTLGRQHEQLLQTVSPPIDLCNQTVVDPYCDPAYTGPPPYHDTVAQPAR